MTTISAKIVADSVSPTGKRLTTMELRAPRFILAEFNTHRAFSRNARSSRAVPVPKMIQECIDDPVIPRHWGAAQKGMQAYEECDSSVTLREFFRGSDGVLKYAVREVLREEAWLKARDHAVEVARSFHDAGYAKQVINRLLEPFLHVDILVTATDWLNWDGLRDHHMAEPHIEMLAKAMKVVRAESVPKLLQPGEWHLPYVDDWSTLEVTALEGYRLACHEGDPRPENEIVLDFRRKVSVARCARISYAPFDGDASIKAELKRYDILVGSDPLHASPAEHQATPDTYISDKAMVKQWKNPGLHRNFVGWIQNRAVIGG